MTAANHQARLAVIRRQTAVAVTRLWDRLDRYDADIAAPFAARVVPLVAAGQLLAARTTNAYVARLAQIRPVPLTAAQVTGRAARRGVDPLDEYQRPFGAVWSALDDDIEPMEAAGRGRSRLASLAVTDVWLATRTATEVIDRATAAITGWVHVADAGACELCSSADGMPLAEAADFAGHPNCFPADTLVSANARRAFRRRYAGELAVITTASGQEIAATANHPVLTDGGWVPAHLLREGDCVVRALVGDGRPREEHRPARIEDVWRAGAVTGLRRMPVTTQDFHGDGSDGEVHVVDTDRHLSAEGDAAGGETVDQRLLVLRSRTGSAFTRFRPLLSFGDGGLPAAHGVMSGSDLGGTLLGSERGHLPSRCFRCRPPLGDALLVQPSFDHLSRYAELQRQRKHALAGEIGSDHVRIELAPVAPRFDPPAMKFSHHRRGAYAGRGLDLLNRLAGQVALDRVVEVARRHWTGHVFNLHTGEGWYTANNLIVSNCGCTSEPTFGESPDSTADPDGVEIEEHGELGRVLVAPTRVSSEEDSIARSRALPAGTDTTSTAVQDVLNLAGPAGNR